MLNSCEKQKTCHECIMDPNVCIWCKNENFTRARCRPADSYDKSWCLEIENPQFVRNINKDLEFDSKPGHVIQIKPQKYKIQLRPGQKVDFKFAFKGAKDYPVDLYFLLDASASMEGMKRETANESENIYKAMSNITKDVFLGIGNFIDKNALPFTYILEKPFTQGAISNVTYSFRNRLKLINSPEKFKSTLDAITFGKNYDVPEGGLDALAQVIVCKNEIGWRDESRKIVVFMTDGLYHAAGDGKLAGIFKPYDGKCYTEDGIYTKEIEMDYPSVSMINKLAADEEVIVIFAVPSSIQYVYKKLSQTISGSHQTTYDDTVGRITTILRDIYEKITRSIKLKVNLKSDDRPYFKLNFDPECSKYSDISDCNVEIGKDKHFTGTIQLLEYYGKDNIQIDVAVEGIKEKLILDIDVIKTCDCERSTGQINSEFCNGGGTLQCGICNCNEDRYGEKCICTKSKHTVKADNSTCIAEGGTELCNGHGTCFCGTCDCGNRYEGQYCECNKDSCPRDSNGFLCSGHGNCECGTCKCRPEWSGPKCNCYMLISPCSDDGKVCNNRGKCVCGSCDCQPIANWDARNVQSKLCKMAACPDCHDRQCRLLESCAICHHRQNEDCSKECSQEIIVNTTKSINETVEDVKSWNPCVNIRVDVGCYTHFLYQYDDNSYKIKLLVQTEKDCLESYYMFGGISLGILILIGLTTLLIWKLLTDARDRREYERFVKEHAADLSGHSTNPIYAPATTTYHNPVFGRSFTRR